MVVVVEEEEEEDGFGKDVSIMGNRQMDHLPCCIAGWFLDRSN